MSEPVALLLSAVVGLGLGALHFGGLWWTVHRAVSARRPALLFVASSLVRVAVTVSVLVLISNGRWQRIVAALAGFVLARAVAVGATRRLAGDRGNGGARQWT